MGPQEKLQCCYLKERERVGVGERRVTRCLGTLPCRECPTGAGVEAGLVQEEGSLRGSWVPSLEKWGVIITCRSPGGGGAGGEAQCELKLMTQPA